MTRLPPLDALHVFAVAARHLSFTTAAADQAAATMAAAPPVRLSRAAETT
jgi:hypothetical protein